MAILTTNSNFALDALKALGLSTENLKEVHIHLVPAAAVVADCVYYITEPPLFSITELQTVIKKYELHFEENKSGKIPFTLDYPTLYDIASLKRYRIEVFHLSLRELSKKAGVSATTISRLER